MNFNVKKIKQRKIFSIIASLGELSEEWLVKNNFYRQKALGLLVRDSGFSKRMSEALLDATFRELTRKKLTLLLKSELGDPRALDGFCFNKITGNRSYAKGPRILTHIFSANIPNPAVSSLVHGMLVKSANIIKVSKRDAGILPVYLESLKKHDAMLSKTNLLLDSESHTALNEWVNASDAVVVYGSDETVGQVRKMAGPEKIFAGYGHRVSFSLYSREALNKKEMPDLAKKTARDVWMADQRGCLSPAVVYVEAGGAVSGLKFAQSVAEALRGLSLADQGLRPAGPQRILDKEDLKNRWKLKKVKGEEAHFWESSVRGEWAVFFEQKNPEFSHVSGGQSVFIREYKNLKDVSGALSPYGKYLQAAALEAPGAKRESIAQILAELGVNRVTRAGCLQEPPASWHHDGMPNLAGWLRWTDLE